MQEMRSEDERWNVTSAESLSIAKSTIGKTTPTRSQAKGEESTTTALGLVCGRTRSSDRREGWGIQDGFNDGITIFG